MSTGWFPRAVIKETEKIYVGNPGLWGVVLHVADDGGNYDGSVRWLRGSHNKKSSAHAIINNANGEITQMASIHDRTWANGLRWIAGVPWSPSANRPIIGDKRARMWRKIERGKDPNRYTISVERSGRPTDPWTPVAMSTLIEFLAYIAKEKGLIYVPGDTLVGHRDVDPLGKAFCPGPQYNFDEIAHRANGLSSHPITSEHARYVVVRGPAIVRYTPTRESAEIRQLPTGTPVFIDKLEPKGQRLNLYGLQSSQWARLSDGGWVWSPLLRRES